MATFALVGCGGTAVSEFDASTAEEPCEASNASSACVGQAPATLHLLPDERNLGVLTATAGIAVVGWDAERLATAFVGPTGYDTPSPDDKLLGCTVTGAPRSVFLGSRQLNAKTRLWDFTEPFGWVAGPDGSAPILGASCGDVDGDGLDDLVGLWTPDDELRLFRGSERFGSGWETSVDLSEAGVPSYVTMLVDLDGDGAVELVLSSLDEPMIHVISDLAEGATARSVRWDPGVAQIGALHGVEGTLQLVWVGSNTDGTGVLGAHALDGAFEPLTDEVFETVSAPNRVFVADIDGDGMRDALVASMPGAEYVVHVGSDTGGFSPGGTIELPSDVLDLALGDFDGDGYQDLASLPAGTDQLMVVWGDGALLASDGS